MALILFIPHQPTSTKGIRNNNQTNPALWIQASEPAGILPIRVPDVVTSSIGSPPKRPNVITSGTKICMVVTPKFPSPAFSPNARPCCFLGKKKLMFDIDEAKFPPPNPESSASTWNTHRGVFLSCKAIPVPIAGIINRAVVNTMVLRPPAKRIKKLLGILNVAPVNPATAIRVNNSLLANGNPRFSI